MCTKNDLQLSLNGDTFQALKTDFDSILARTIGNMEMKGADEATITIKLGISLEKVNNGSYDEAKEVTKPSFKHDISSVMQVKDKKTGSLSGDYELVWDEEEKKYVMRRLGGEQMSLFDESVDPGEQEADGENVAEGGPYLEAPEDKTLYLEASYEECDDTERREEELSALKWLSMFIGRKMKIVESNGTYTVRTDTNEVVLTSADSMFHVDAEILEEHLDHEINCLGFYSEATANQSGSLEAVEFKCLDCDEVIYEYPSSADGEAEYEGEPDIAEPDLDDDELMEYDEPELD